MKGPLTDREIKKVLPRICEYVREDYAMMNDKAELCKMTDKEAIAYHHICEMSLGCLMSQEDRKLTERHLKIIKEILAERNLTPTAGP